MKPFSGFPLEERSVGMTAPGAKRSFGEPTITLGAKAWLTSLSCRKAKELGYSHELWITRLLARHAREHGPAEGHPCLANTKMAVARVAAPDWSCAGSRGGGANPRHRVSGVEAYSWTPSSCSRECRALKSGTPSTPRMTASLRHQRTNLLNTEDNEKSFPNVSDVTGK
jgi:hypothetical protein